LISLTHDARRTATQQFLEGLSSDELRYIADFLGARLIEPELCRKGNRDLTARAIERYQKLCNCHKSTSPDVCHKMILLLEYLATSELTVSTKSFPAAGGRA
jgi:hypothetical protein